MSNVSDLNRFSARISAGIRTEGPVFSPTKATLWNGGSAHGMRELALAVLDNMIHQGPSEFLVLTIHSDLLIRIAVT